MSSTLTFQLLQQKDTPSAPTVNLPSPPDSSCGGDESRDMEQTARGPSENRRDSLQTYFNALTIHHFSKSLPDNYTIDHSSPIPIQSLRRPSHSPRPDSPFLSPASTAAAAGTGGRTVRHRRPSESAASLGRKSRVLSESPGKQALHRCEECGKVYKHPNCLSKHRWEHSEEWELTSKLLLTKHQQVQMLEAAAILVGMDASRRSSVMSDRKPSVSEPVVEVDDDTEEEQAQAQVEKDEETEEDNRAVDDDDDDILIDMEEDDDKPYESSSSFSLKSRSASSSMMPH